MNDTHPRTSLSADLLEVFRRETGVPDLAYAEEPTPIGGGFWADILAVRLVGAPDGFDGDLVVRIMPDELLGHRETVVQREVADQGFPAPAVRLFGDADDGLGRPFMVMDRAPGAPLLSGLTAGNAIVSLPRVIRRLPHLLADTALRLHLLGPEPVVTALRREVPAASIDTADMLTSLGAAANVLDNAELRRAVDWLHANRPVPERVSICHGDLHPFNLLVEDNNRVTLIDWSASRISEPAFDLAFTLLMIREAPLDAPPRVAPVLRKAAHWLADRVLTSYRRAATEHGIVVDDRRLAWYTALQSTRVLTEFSHWGPDDHPGHPFRSMSERVRTQLAATIST